MIRYVKGGRVRFHQSREPQPPFWQATTISPYSPDVRLAPLGIDFVRMKATVPRSMEVTVPETLDGTDLDRLPSPILIDAHGAEESVYRRGDRLLHELPTDARSLLLLSVDGDVPRAIAAASPLLVLAAWPLDLKALAALAQRASGEALPWGIFVPIVYPVITNREVLRKIANIAGEHRARFVASAAIELDSRSRSTLAAMDPDLDEETWATLFDADLDQIHLAAERHLSALAHELGLEDAIDPWLGESRSNRAAASFLGKIGSRMVRMDHDVELGWMFLKAAGRLASLDKEITRLAATAPLSILPELDDEIISAVVRQWLETGAADFASQIDEKWRIRLPAGE